MSQNACWRRHNRLKQEGFIQNATVVIDPKRVGLDLTVFMLVRTRHHSQKWLADFRQTVLSIRSVVDCFRIAGDHDYLLKVVVTDMNQFGHVYQTIIDKVELDTVSSYVTMEAIANNRSLPL